jgi:hypothetical protein
MILEQQSRWRFHGATLRGCRIQTFEAAASEDVHCSFFDDY